MQSPELSIQNTHIKVSQALLLRGPHIAETRPREGLSGRSEGKVLGSALIQRVTAQPDVELLERAWDFADQGCLEGLWL